MAITSRPSLTPRNKKAENRKALRKRLAPYDKRKRPEPDIWEGHDEPIGLTEAGMAATDSPSDELDIAMASLQPYMPSQEEIERQCKNIRAGWSKGGDV